MAISHRHGFQLSSLSARRISIVRIKVQLSPCLAEGPRQRSEGEREKSALSPSPRERMLIVARHANSSQMEGRESEYEFEREELPPLHFRLVVGVVSGCCCFIVRARLIWATGFRRGGERVGQQQGQLQAWLVRRVCVCGNHCVKNPSHVMPDCRNTFGSHMHT